MRWFISIASGTSADFVRQYTLLTGAHDTVHVQHKTRQEISYRERKLLYAGQDSIKGHPDVKRAVDVPHQRNIDRPFIVLHSLPRCRGPPPSEFSKFRWKRRNIHAAAE